MKRKVKRYDGGGNVVRTRTDDEIAEDSKFGGYGRYMPKTKEYSLDEVKGKLSGLFGGSGSDSSKFSELESVGGPGRRARSIEEQIGRKAAPKEETKEPDSVAGKGARNLALEDKEDETPAPVKKAMKVAEKAEPKKAAPKKEAEPKFVKEGEKLGSQGSFKFDSKPMSVEEARKKAKEMTSSKKGPTEAEKESGRKFSEEKLKKQKEGFESSPIGGFLKRLGESPMEKAERKAKEIRGYKSGGSVSSASKRADGIAQRGKTRGRIC
jgi:hypothetical protein